MAEQHKIIWTIGHSNRPFVDFLNMLQSFNIELVADIRSFPSSHKFPQYNKDELEILLPKNRVQYVHLPLLGGRRPVNKDSKNTAWHNKAFRGYADYMDTPFFKNGILQLEALALKQPTAFMCSEAVWWRCHRSMVADYLKVNGWCVLHIMNLNQQIEHPFTTVAKIINGELSY